MAHFSLYETNAATSLALRGIDLEGDGQEVDVLAGPSRCGQGTIFRLIVRLQAITRRLPRNLRRTATRTTPPPEQSNDRP